MPKPKRPTKPVHTIARPCVTRPIIYDDGFDLQWVAYGAGWSAGGLRKVSENAIRTRHQDAFIEHECHTTHKPHIHCLLLNQRRNLRVYFTVERHAVLIRGYFWDVAGSPWHDRTGGVVFW